MQVVTLLQKSSVPNIGPNVPNEIFNYFGIVNQN